MVKVTSDAVAYMLTSIEREPSNTVNRPRPRSGSLINRARTDNEDENKNHSPSAA